MDHGSGQGVRTDARPDTGTNSNENEGFFCRFSHVFPIFTGICPNVIIVSRVSTEMPHFLPADRLHKNFNDIGSLSVDNGGDAPAAEGFDRKHLRKIAKL